MYEVAVMKKRGTHDALVVLIDVLYREMKIGFQNIPFEAVSRVQTRSDLLAVEDLY